MLWHCTYPALGDGTLRGDRVMRIHKIAMATQVAQPHMAAFYVDTRQPGRRLGCRD